MKYGRKLSLIIGVALITSISASAYTAPPISDTKAGGTVYQDPTTLATNYAVTDTAGNQGIYSLYPNMNYTISVSTTNGANTTFAYRNINYQNQYGQESLIINDRYTLVWNTTNGDVNQLWINNNEIGHKDSSGNWIINQAGYSMWITCNTSIVSNTYNPFQGISNYLNQNIPSNSKALAPMRLFSCGLAVAEYIGSWVSIAGCAETFGLGCVLGLVLHAHAGVGIAQNCG